MKITRDVPYTRPRVSLTSVTTGGDSGPSGHVLTSSGSNGASAWGSNVAIITSNSSNQLTGPFVNFASGTGVAFAAASNTLTISASGAGDTFADLGWFNVEDYGAVHNGVTDDTASIQAALNACHAAGGGTVYFPPGIYQLNGALQDTSTYNSQLKLPYNAWWDEGGDLPMAIRLLGSTPPTPGFGTSGASVLRSSWSGTISGTPSIISAGTHDNTTTPNWMYLWVENIEIRAPENPKLSAIDMTGGASVRCNNVTIGVQRTTDFEFANPWAVPTNSNAIALDMPWGLNSQMEGGDALNIQGFYTGLRPSEQFTFGFVSVGFCRQAVEFRGQVDSGGLLRHACYITRVDTFFCPRGLVFTGDERWVNIGMFCVEHEYGIYTAVYDIDDANNYGRGFIGWHTTDFTDGPEDDLLVNGGAGLSLFGAYAKRWKLTHMVDVPTGTDPPTNPTNGFRLYAASATGKPTTRSSSGTVTTLMREGDTAGGDLAGTYPNPTVTDDSHSHTSATVPGSGEILISDTPAGSPLVFTDLLQNEAQDDLIYSG